MAKTVENSKLVDKKAVLSFKPQKSQFNINFIKDLSRVKAGFKSVPLQLYFEFRATFQHCQAQQFKNKFGEERF